MIQCPKCKTMTHGSRDTRNTSDGRVKRIRVCSSCGYRFTTYEVYIDEMSPVELNYAFMATNSRRRQLRLSNAEGK